MDLVKPIRPECKREIIGIRPGEKLHEVMIPRDDARNALEFDNYYLVQADVSFFKHRSKNDDGKPVPEDFEYSSKTNTPWLTVEELIEMVEKI